MFLSCWLLVVDPCVTLHLFIIDMGSCLDISVCVPKFDCITLKCYYFSYFIITYIHFDLCFSLYFLLTSEKVSTGRPTILNAQCIVKLFHFSSIYINALNISSVLRNLSFVSQLIM